MRKLSSFNDWDNFPGKKLRLSEYRFLREASVFFQLKYVKQYGMVDPDVENCCQQCWENSNIGKIKFFFSFEKKKLDLQLFFSL